MTAAAEKRDTTPRVYYSTSTRPLPLENSDPLTLGQRVTLRGEPFGNAIAYIETGALVLAPDDEQPGKKTSRQTKSDQGA